MLVSIIIPAYNSEKVIGRCLESIVNRHTNEVEIIIVDDGSSDKTVSVCQSYINNGAHNLKIFSQKNMGPSLARQNGLKYSNGDYILFIDSDDYLNNNALDIICETIHLCSFDICQFGYINTKVMSENRKEFQEGIPFNRLTKCVEKPDEYFFRDKRNTYYLWDKIYKRSLFDEIVFPELYYSEDVCILTQLFYKTRKMILIEHVLYIHVENNECLTKSPFSYRMLDQVEASKFIVNFVSENMKYYKLDAIAYLSSQCTRNYIKLVNVMNDKEKAKEIRHIFLDYNDCSSIINMRQQNIINNKKLYMFMLMKICPSGFAKLCSFLNILPS